MQIKNSSKGFFKLWLRQALTISVPEPGSYYTVLDPLDFYEWRYNGFAPKGAIFTTKLPPSDIFTEGKVIASAVVPIQNLAKADRHFKLNQDTPISIIIKAGHIPNPTELLAKYNQMKTSFAQGLKSFKEHLILKKYTFSQSKDPHLMKLHSSTDDEITLQSLGSIEDLTAQFANIHSALSKECIEKIGRSREVEKFRRYDNAMTYVNNSHLDIDTAKMDQLIKSVSITSAPVKKTSWRDCYIEMSVGGGIIAEQMQEYESKKWVQDLQARQRNLA
jgi:hypothetical protein